MKKVRRTINSKVVEIEIEEKEYQMLLSTADEAFIDNYFVMTKKELDRERAETRRHQSLERSVENGHEFEDATINIELEFEQEESFNELILCLNDEQKKLVKMIYIEGYSQKEVAEQRGVGKTAINNQLKRIFEKIKKNLF